MRLDLAVEDAAAESIERDGRGIADMAVRDISIGNRHDRPHLGDHGDGEQRFIARPGRPRGRTSPDARTRRGR